ncbi:hypothetical protein RvVAT039_pl08800 (plasmid) [Agrobacterium vitis]|nr:hypothetical protein RvVAT039_pl08800 [Agrobacterium vitis]
MRAGAIHEKGAYNWLRCQVIAKCDESETIEAYLTRDMSDSFTAAKVTRGESPNQNRSPQILGILS